MKIVIPASDYPLLIRTDFKNNYSWDTIKDKITSPENKYEAAITFIDDHKFDNLSLTQLPFFGSEQDQQDFIFIADSISMLDLENPILCVNLAEDFGNQFRVIPSMVWAVANNLFIVKMEFNDFIEAVDSDGVFRGFDDTI